jgi:hypothetical protein
MTLKTEELEEKLKTSLTNNKLLQSDMADILKKQEENNSENVRTLQSEVKELKNKLKVNEKNTVNLTRNIIAEGHHYCSFHLNIVFYVAILSAFAGGCQLLEECNATIFSSFHSEDGGHMFLQNVDMYISHYTDYRMSLHHCVNLRSHTLFVLQRKFIPRYNICICPDFQ